MDHHTSSGNQYSNGISGFVAGLRYEAIPVGVIARIKLLMLDSLGCANFGAALLRGRILQQTLGKVDTSEGCPVWGGRSACRRTQSVGPEA